MPAAACTWWDQALQVAGYQTMEKRLSPQATWEEVLASGREDLQPALTLAGMTTGPEKKVLDLGCGVGRISQALAEYFGEVVGVDPSSSLITEARARNRHSHVSYRVHAEEHLLPTCSHYFDVVFSYEVLYYLPPQEVRGYFHDVARLLKPGGEFVFQMNLAPIHAITRVSGWVRTMLYGMGIQYWRGWPTTPALRRRPYTRLWLGRELAAAGLILRRVCEHRNERQTWLVARKPEEINRRHG
ncbi:MAG: hypothetical protein KatS3mg113_0698 [Planctomycetaceae bacterium]|nr:MAG: hypothetical protein KatS3mg113_0698 [Planctomycetaceae bacterium]